MTKLERAIMEWAAEQETAGTPEFHGYLVTRGVKYKSRFNLPIGHGTLYNALYRLERDGWLASRWEDSELAEREHRPRRRLYRRARPAPAPEGGA